MDSEKRKAELEHQAKTAEVFIYSIPTCQYCGMAKAYLKSRGINFTDYNVSADMGRAREMVAMTNQDAVPVLQINGRLVVGFNKRLIEDALARKKPIKREDGMRNLIFDPFARDQ